MQKYNKIMRLMSGTGKYTYRLELVHSSYKLGINPAARLHKCTVKTVRKWRRRYEWSGASGLHEQSRRPHRMPNKCPAEFEQKIIAIKST